MGTDSFSWKSSASLCLQESLRLGLGPLEHFIPNTFDLSSPYIEKEEISVAGLRCRA